MENAVVETKKSLQVRNIEVVTKEIKEIQRQAQIILATYAIEIGRRLVEAKGMLQHGEWGNWLQNEVNFSHSTANNYMKLFEEFGGEQLTFFGAVSNSQLIGNLPYTKALQLLLLPAEERETFAEEAHAEDMSVAELKKAIQERNEARKAAEEAKAREAEIAEKMGQAELAAAEAEKKAAESDELRKKVQALEESLKASEERVQKAKERAKKAEQNPKIPPETLKEIQEEAERTAKAEAEKQMSKELEEARAKAKLAEEEKRMAERQRMDAEKSLAEAKQRLRTANPEVAAFKTLFDEFQKMANTLKAKVKAMEAEDPETAKKLAAALKAVGNTLG